MANLRNDRVGIPGTVGASATTQAVTRSIGITGAGASRFRLDFYTGKVASASGITVGMQQSSGPTWSTTKTAAVSASTQKTLSGLIAEISTITLPTYAGATQGDYLHATAAGGTTYAAWLNKRIAEVAQLTFESAAATDHQDFVVVTSQSGLEFGLALTKPVASVDTVNFPDTAASTGGDYFVVYDAAGLAWAAALNKSGADPAPTGAIYAAIPAGRKTNVDISGAVNDEDVAALVETALNALTGFSAAFTTDDTAADGTMLITRDTKGPTTAPVVKNADDSGAGSITSTNTTAGVASTAPTGPIWTALSASRKGIVDVSGATDAASVAALAEIGFNALTGFTALITTNDVAANGTMLLTQVTAGAVANPVPKNAAEDGAGGISVAINTAGVTTGAAPTGALYLAADEQIQVDILPGGTAAASGTAFAAAFDAAASADFVTVDALDGTVSLTQVTPAAVADPAPKREDDGAAGSISVSVGTAGDDGDMNLATDVFTSTTHGYSTDDPLVVSTTGTLPAGLTPDTIYYAQVIDANTYKLRSIRGNPDSVVNITTMGIGTHSTTLVRRFSLQFNAEVAGDQSYLPLAPQCRGYVTTGASDSCQILDVRAVQAD